MGGELNAATSRETTVVLHARPRRPLEIAIDVMSDMVFRPRFDDVDSEREVVLEEIAMVDDNPQRSRPRSRHRSGVRRPSARTARDRQRRRDREREQARAPGVSPRRVRRQEHRRRRRGERRPPEFLNLLANTRRAARRDRSGWHGSPRRRLRAPRCGSSARTPSSTTSACGAGNQPHRRAPYAATLLDAIVGGSASSRLFQEIREKRGMAYSVYTLRVAVRRRRARSVSTSARARRTSRECMEIVAAELRDVAAGNLRPGELDRAKEN